MIFRRKPNSDERMFSDTAESHVAENIIRDPHAPMLENYRNTQPGAVRYAFSLGRDGGLRWSDCAIDIDWQDITDMIEFLAKVRYPPAVALFPFVRNPEGLRSALDALVEATQGAKQPMNDIANQPPLVHRGARRIAERAGQILNEPVTEEQIYQWKFKKIIRTFDLGGNIATRDETLVEDLTGNRALIDDMEADAAANK